MIRDLRWLIESGMSRIVPIDFEFNGTSEYSLNLVCCSMEVKGTVEEYWIYNDPDAKEALKKRLLSLRKQGFIFMTYNVIAEAHAFISLGIDPTKAKWIDLQQEYKMILNHNHEYMYGKQLIDGREVVTQPPVYGVETTVNNSKPKKSLAACTYKLLDIKIDTDHKDMMRDIIIEGDERKIKNYRYDIQKYCSSDIAYLRPIWSKMISIYDDYFKRSYEYTKKEMKDIGLTYNENKHITVTDEEVRWRGETAARTALMQATGYPVNVEKVTKFADSVSLILRELCEDINSQFDEELKFFKWNKKEQRYSLFQKPLKKWIHEKYEGRWLRTNPTKNKPNGDYSLSLDAWERHFSYSHDYPRNEVGAQVLRYLKTRRSLNGFLPKSPTAKNKENFFDSLGSDGRVRAYLNPYGAQSARFQPKATGFIPLKSAWMRSLIEPEKGKAIASYDYSSQEFLISALVAEDKNMIEAYKSGDVYLYFAKLAGAVPWDGKKDDYKEARNLFKSTTLGISYSMGEKALAAKLSMDTGKDVTVEDAKDLINKFNKAYPDYADFVDRFRFDYSKRRYTKAVDGWIMFADNDNKRSVSNQPIQTFGSCILRKAIQLCQDRGLKVLYPLHDALYIEYDIDKPKEVVIFEQCMREAFSFYFEGEIKDLAHELIRLDLNVWSPDYKDGQEVKFGDIRVKAQQVYVDERSESEYLRFKKYWE